MASRDYFKGKRIAIIGLGSHGEMVTDAKFLIKAGALVSVYDLRSESRLKDHLLFLRSIGLANYICGSIPPDDLLDMDIIILSHEYPRESSFLKGAKEKNITIEYPETLFFKLVPPITLVGVMGSCGKATVVSMLAPMLEVVCKYDSAQNMFVLDPESDDGILSHLKKTKTGDIVLIRIVENMMKELCDLRVSPHVAVFTSIPPNGSYVNNPFEILNHQTYNNFIVASDEIIDAIHRYKFQTKAKMLRTKTSIFPEDWIFAGQGHDRDNAALALQVSQLFKVTDEVAQESFEKWKPLRGRLEMVKKVKGIIYYNDAASISPDSTISALMSLSESRNLVLILGGAEGGGDYTELFRLIPKYVHTVILLPGSGTMKERKVLKTLDKVEIISVPSVEEAVYSASEKSKTGDKVLFSPGFAARGFDSSSKERGDRFVRAVRSL